MLAAQFAPRPTVVRAQHRTQHTRRMSLSHPEHDAPGGAAVVKDRVKQQFDQRAAAYDSGGRDSSVTPAHVPTLQPPLPLAQRTPPAQGCLKQAELAAPCNPSSPPPTTRREPETSSLDLEVPPTHTACCRRPGIPPNPGADAAAAVPAAAGSARPGPGMWHRPRCPASRSSSRAVWPRGGCGPEPRHVAAGNGQGCRSGGGVSNHHVCVR